MKYPLLFARNLWKQVQSGETAYALKDELKK